MPDSHIQPATLDDVLTELHAVRVALEAGAPEGLDAAAAAAFVGVHRSKWHELVSRGLAPEAAQLGDRRCPRWSRGELVAWIRSGAPSRQRWQVMRHAEMRRAG